MALRLNALRPLPVALRTKPNILGEAFKTLRHPAPLGSSASPAASTGALTSKDTSFPKRGALAHSGGSRHLPFLVSGMLFLASFPGKPPPLKARLKGFLQSLPDQSARRSLLPLCHQRPRRPPLDIDYDNSACVHFHARHPHQTCRVRNALRLAVLACEAHRPSTNI